ncbi:hypothetical protein OG799_28525 [Micromonospora sp. NBC_00898]|uniref:helix-turn-helix domain-containing protein n=1 Tax=Micromonospora sp. NBC_00898 TaxID=2975981 RepID=UPI00386E6CC6|nr:hypothetical protein OG799_28525 [Micromonospora sp. NBC_00898]
MLVRTARCRQAARVAERVRVREIDDDEGQRLLRIVRNVIHSFNADGIEALYPKYKGGRPRTFTLPERREIKKIAKSKPAEHGLPFSTWSLRAPRENGHHRSARVDNPQRSEDNHENSFASRRTTCASYASWPTFEWLTSRQRRASTPTTSG